MRCVRGKSQRSSGVTQTTVSTQTAASVFTTGTVWSPWTWSPPTQRRPALGSLGWNTSWLVSVMKIVWLGGSAPVINILYPPTQLFNMVYRHKYITLYLVNWLFSVWFSLNCSWTWLQQTFSEADKNGDGTLSIGEVHQLLHKLNVNLPKQKVRAMFQVRLKLDRLNMNVTSNWHLPSAPLHSKSDSLTWNI